MIVTPYSNITAGKKQQVEKMFNEIAFRYDLINQLLSFGIHKQWRKKAIELLQKKIANRTKPLLLDIATGTGDFAINALTLNPEKIIGIDISEDMLTVGRKKLENKNLSRVIELKRADSENLPFASDNFDGATVGFGIRNFENLEKGLTEICRVLKPSGVLSILEFSMPEEFPMKQFYNFYLKFLCPLLGRMISKNPVAYTYLFKSIKNFPYGNNLKQKLLHCGFTEVEFYPQTFGITTIYVAKK